MNEISSQITKAFWRFNIGMGIYGFTRGFRSDFERSPRKLLFTERLLGSLANSTIYFLPVYNIYQLYRIINRLEIYSRGLNKEEYKSAYEEPFSGICKDTL